MRLAVLGRVVALGLWVLAPHGLASASPSTTESRELSLSVGENRTLSAQGVKSYSEGTEGIVEVRLTPEGGEFVVVGKQPGETSLLLIHGDGRQVLYGISVFRRPMAAVEDEVARLLADDTGIRIRRVGPRLFIEGGVSTQPEQERIAHIASLYPGQVESLVVLGGTAAERKHNVRLDVYFVQLDRSRSFDAGVRWPGEIGGAALSGQYDLLKPGFVSATAQVVNQPLLGLDLAQVNGFARVLKHSTLITANGVKADFSSGGEQNFAVSNGLAAQLAQVQFGTTVTVLPRYDPTSREIQVEVSAEVSDLTSPVTAATDLPGRTVTNLNTQVTLKLGQALIMSGIHTSTNRATRSGVPGLSQVPIVGALFETRSNRAEMVDGAIFLVPSVIDAVPRTSRKLVEELMGLYEGFDGAFKAVAMPLLDAERSP